jgi:hypothetical protein
VAVSGATGIESRDSLTKPFEEKYRNEVMFFGALRRDTYFSDRIYL